MAVVTKTLRSSGGDYSLMSTWESTEQTDLVSDGDTHVLECYNDWPSGLSDSVSITGWTANASYFVTVKAAAGQGHGGVPGAGFRLVSSVNAPVVDANVSYTVLQGLEVEKTFAGYDTRPVVELPMWGVADKLIVSNGAATNGTPKGIQVGYQGCLIRNCLVHNIPESHAVGIQADGESNTVQNCTVVGIGLYGYRSYDKPATFTNCVAYDIASTNFSGTAMTMTYCASEDATATGTGSVTGITSADFVDYAGGDYAPANGGALDGAGTDLSAFFDDDITGTAR